MIISVGLGLFTVLCARLIFSFLFHAPYKLFRDKELELEKYTWDAVSFDLVNFPMINEIPVWAMRIRSDKHVPIQGFYFGVAEISSDASGVVFSENNHIAHFGYIDRDSGATRERIVSQREILINKKSGWRKTPPFMIEPHIDYDFVLTKMIAPDKYVFVETEPTEINIVPKNIIVKLKAVGTVEVDNQIYQSGKIIYVRFDKNGKPKKL